MKYRFIYLHGFGSSPKSAKADFLADRLSQLGFVLEAPDLNVPSFDRLTLTAMIDKLKDIIDADVGEVYLVGASMGAQVALHFMDKYGQAYLHKVKKILLLAPSFDFLDNRRRQLGEAGLDEWKQSGYLNWKHFDHGKEYRLHYGLVEDMLKYEKYPTKLPIPVYAIHGYLDKNVDHRQSIVYASGAHGVTLHLVPSDHGLKSEFERIWRILSAFFDLPRLALQSRSSDYLIEELRNASVEDSADLDFCMKLMRNCYGLSSIPEDIHRDRLRRECRKIFVAKRCSTSQIVGMTIVSPFGKRCAICVDNAFRGDGIAHLLVFKSLISIEKQFTEISYDNEKLIRLLTLCGFSPLNDELKLRNALALSGSIPSTIFVDSGGIKYERPSGSRPGLTHKFIMMQKLASPLMPEALG